MKPMPPRLPLCRIAALILLAGCLPGPTVGAQAAEPITISGSVPSVGGRIGGFMKSWSYRSWGKAELNHSSFPLLLSMATMQLVYRSGPGWLLPLGNSLVPE
jgi:hypothetical protein